MKLSNKQEIQENTYDFPYHYIPQIVGNKFTQSYTVYWGYEYLSYIHFVLNKIKELKFDTILDLGCGDGRFLYEANKYFQDKDLFGLDYSEKAIKFAKLMNPSGKYYCGDITNPNIFDFKFDLITCIEVLEHIPLENIKRFVEGIHYYLDRKGYVLITVPTKNVKVIQKHYQHFDLISLKKLLEKHFIVKKLFYINRQSWMVNLIDRLLSNRFLILNSKSISGVIYYNYINNFIHANKKNAKRIVLICKPIE